MPSPTTAAPTPAEEKRERELAHLLHLLATRHTGAANGISADRLAGELHLLPRHLRELITEARLAGSAICGRPETGYYIARTSAELEETCQFLRGRSMSSLEIEAALRRMPLPDLLGQLHLPT